MRFRIGNVAANDGQTAAREPPKCAIHPLAEIAALVEAGHGAVAGAFRAEPQRIAREASTLADRGDASAGEIAAGDETARKLGCGAESAAAFAGSVEILGVWGTVRADWNPAYGLLVVPIVFLARFNGYAVIGFTLFFSALMIGGESAARRVGVPQHFVLVLVALLLIFLALVEYLDFIRRKRRTA